MIELEKFIDYSFDNRGTETGRQLWEKLEKKEIEGVTTDHWRAYAEFLPEKIRTQSKAETYAVEEYNSTLKYFLARLNERQSVILRVLKC